MRKQNTWDLPAGFSVPFTHVLRDNDDGQGTPPAQPPAANETSAEADNTDDEGGGKDGKDGKEHMIPKSRFDEINQRRKDAEAKLAEYAAAEAKAAAERKAAEDKALEEQQKYQQLAEKRKTELDAATASLTEAQAQIEQLTAALQAYYEKEMKGVPDYVAPLLEKLSLPDRLKWLSENQTKWAKNGGPPPTPDDGGSPKMSDEERRKRAYRTRL